MKTKRDPVSVNYYSSKAVYEMDPDIARDLMQLEDD